MSLIDLSSHPDVAPAPLLATQRSVVAARWLRLMMVCAVLVGSGGVRWWQARRVGAVLERGQELAFPAGGAADDPGDWRGEDATLDPQIARRTGATDLIIRRYVDQGTGAAVEVIVLYGPAVEMYIHMPEVCYPAAGYAQVGRPRPAGRSRRGGVGRRRSGRWSIAKGEGGQADLQEVYYSWRYQRPLDPRRSARRSSSSGSPACTRSTWRGA